MSEDKFCFQIPDDPDSCGMFRMTTVSMTLAQVKHLLPRMREWADSNDRIARLEDAAAEQSRNESMRVQRLVDSVKELDGALKRIAAMNHNDGYALADAARVADRALRGGAK